MNWLSNLSVRLKLALLFAAAAASLVLLTAMNLWSLHSSTTSTRTLVAEDFAAVRQLGEMRASIGNMRRFEKDLFLNMSEESDLDKYHAAWRKEVAAGLGLAGALTPRLTGEEQQSVARMRTGLEAYRNGVETIVAGIRTGKVNDPWAANKAMEPFKADVRAADKAFAEILSSVNKRVEGREEDLQGLEQRTLVRSGLAAVTLLILIAALAWMIERQIVLPLQRAGQAMRRIAAGDLSQMLVAHGRDEIAKLGQDIIRMQAAWVTLVTQLRDGVEAVSTASAEIAQGSSDLSVRTETQAANLQQTAASMEQLTATVATSTQHAQDARQLAHGARDVAQQGGDVVGKVVHTMEAIQGASRQIADITAVIDGIAFQTNILALNASVEAARAGEQGRGFAVVAGEVRLLAQRSSEAARQIKALIAASAQRVDEGAELVRTAGTTMSDIVQQVQRVHGLIDEISTAARGQSAGITQVGQAVSSLDGATQQNAALVEQSAAAAESLRHQAAALAAAVATFRLPPASAQA